MRPLESYVRLQALHRTVLANEEVATAWGTSASATYHALADLEADCLVRRLRRGVWAVPTQWGRIIDALEVLPVLTRPYPSYGSLWTALATHGLIDQIPRSFYAVSLDRARVISTSIGEFQVHAIHPDLFGGMVGESGSRAGMATPEKALFDTVYLLTVHRLKRLSLPEITLTEDFDHPLLWSWVDRNPSGRLWTIITGRVRQLLATADSSHGRQGVV